MTVIPNKEYSDYLFKPRKREDSEILDKINRNFRQLPFTKQLKLSRQDVKAMGSNIYLLCSARVALSSDLPLKVNLAFVSDKDEIKNELFIPYKLPAE